MRVSEKKRDAAYGAIHEAIMDLRIALSKDGVSAKHDAMIAQLEHRIWRGVVKEFGIVGDR